MVNNVTNISPSERIRQRARKMLCRKRAPNAWRVTAKERGHRPKLVEFVKDVALLAFVEGVPLESAQKPV
jgi:hypothetical protein